jgi:hypothetical protein
VALSIAPTVRRIDVYQVDAGPVQTGLEREPPLAAARRSVAGAYAAPLNPRLNGGRLPNQRLRVTLL